MGSHRTILSILFILSAHPVKISNSTAPLGFGRAVNDLVNAAPVAPLRGRRILIVDDEPTTIDLLCAILEADGCTVLVATTGETAVLAARRSRPDLIVLDVRLPGIDGFVTCEQLTAHPVTAATPVIFYTATEEPSAEAMGRAAGGADFIPKRLPWSTVIERIHRHLLGPAMEGVDDASAT